MLLKSLLEVTLLVSRSTKDGNAGHPATKPVGELCFLETYRASAVLIMIPLKTQVLGPLVPATGLPPHCRAAFCPGSLIFLLCERIRNPRAKASPSVKRALGRAQQVGRTGQCSG